MTRYQALYAVLGAAGLGAAIVGGRIAIRRWRRKDPDEIERLRRLDVHRRGRIAAAEIVDLVEPESPPGNPAGRRPMMIVYKYEVAGVTYEVSQDISMLPSHLSKGRVFSSPQVSVKYDPKAPTNSIIACEKWAGIEGIGQDESPAI